MTMSNTPGFAQHIQPLFREDDRDTMLFAFDLWDYQDVHANAQDILDRLEDGSMPCDEAWPDERLALFRSWIDGGMPA